MAELNIVLHEPEIPANTGNIGRTCVATGTKLHLIEPLGFSLSEKRLKRAGMDYWKDLDVTVYENWEDFCKRNPGAKIYYATTKGRHEQKYPTQNIFSTFAPFPLDLCQKSSILLLLCWCGSVGRAADS